MENTLKRILAAALLALLALTSFLIVAERATAPETHAKTVASIDEKVETVMKLTATATPIAEKLADFTEYFLLVLTVLYAEKYLLAVLGAGAFKVLIPLACAVMGVSLFCGGKSLRRLAAKLAVLGLALYLVIPASLTVSDLIYGAYEDSIDRTVTAAQELTEETNQLSGAEGDQNLIRSILSRLSETASTLTRKAADTLSRFVETLAVLIVTSCLIPLLVLVFFLWVIKQLLGVDLPPLPMRAPFRPRGGASGRSEG